MFCDSDDSFPDNKLNIVRDFLKSNLVGDTAFLYHSSFSNVSRRSITRRFPAKRCLLSEFYVLNMVNISMSTFICNKAIISHELSGYSWFSQDPLILR